MKLQELSLCEISMLSAKELEEVSLDDIDILFRNNEREYLGVVYSYTSLNSGKKYIGQTRNPKGRHMTHICSSRIGSERSDANSLFSRTLRKEGVDNFDYKILKVCQANRLERLQKLLNTYERYYIAYYDATNRSKGYNCERGGIGEPQGITNHNARPVKQYTRYGEFIREYECINEAARLTGIAASSISQACSSKSVRKVAGGYLWSYSDNTLDASYIKHAIRGIIHRYTIEGLYIDTFQNVNDASKFVDGDKARIHLCAQPPCINVAYGYRWSKEKVSQLSLPPAKSCIEVHKYNDQGVFVATFESLAEASRSINCKSSSHIVVCLNEHWRRAGGYYWRTYKVDKIEISIKKKGGILHG